jgi:hypothetical protein
MITVIVWAAWSAFIAAGIIYLGANTEPYRARWPQAGLAGAALGGAGGLLCRLAWCNRYGALLLGVPFGLVLGVGASLLFSGK